MTAYTGKTAVIIGGTHGIGLATPKLLASGGAKVVITGRRPDPVETARTEFNSTSALVVQSDITFCTSHAELRAQIEKHLGGNSAVIDLLFINAGYSALGSFLEPGGAIVFTTSVSIGQGIPGLALYSVSKAAIYSFVQTMAAELAKGKDWQPGRVNAVSPGFADTPTGGVMDESKESIAIFKDIGAKTTPIGRIATAEEVAKGVLFLGFDATYTTGIEYLMGGGSRFLQPSLHQTL